VLSISLTFPLDVNDHVLFLGAAVVLLLLHEYIRFNPVSLSFSSEKFIHIQRELTTTKTHG
jgi:hypothetical protein